MNDRDSHELLPLRQIVATNGNASRIFARSGMLGWLSNPTRYLIVSLGQGGQIRAVSETALAQARSVLRQAYGPCIAFGQPMAHTYVDPRTGAVMVPMMFLRVDAARANEEELLRLLRERGADVQDVQRQKGRVVIRAECALPHALGLEERIAGLAEGRAHVLSWLLRYQAAVCGQDDGRDERMRA